MMDSMRHPGRRGLKPLTHAIATLTDEPQWTQSPLEDLFLELIRAADLPLPRANILVHGELVDFAWPEAKLASSPDASPSTRADSSPRPSRDRTTLPAATLPARSLAAVIDGTPPLAQSIPRADLFNRGAPIQTLATDLLG